MRRLVFVALVFMACASNPRGESGSLDLPGPDSPPSIAAPGWGTDADAAEQAEDVARWYSVALWNGTVAENERAAAEAAARRACCAPQQTPSYGTSGTVNGYPCGGSLPPCSVLACESGGSPTAENPTSTASGLWQILDGTWAGYGGYSHASFAPVSVQNAKAAALWAGGAGAFHWSACL